jgi:FAS-associated factor 2
VIRYINTRTLFWACNVKSGEGYKVAEALKSGSYPFLALIVLKDNRMTIVGRYVKLIHKYLEIHISIIFLYILIFKYNEHKFLSSIYRLEGAPSSADLTSRLQTIIERNEINLIQARRDR